MRLKGKRISTTSKPKERDQTKGTTKNPWTNALYSPHYHDILEKRKELPAWNAHSEILKLVNKYQVVILQGETGSGKTTQVP